MGLGDRHSASSDGDVLEHAVKLFIAKHSEHDVARLPGQVYTARAQVFRRE